MRRWFRWLSNIVLLLAVLVLLFALVLPLVLSGRAAVVLSGSMEPAMPIGALAITVPTSPEEIEVGDIITYSPYWDPEVTVSHRVVEILPDSMITFRTKGDAAEDEDPWVVPGPEVKGKVVFNIPYVGFFIDSVLGYIQSWTGLILLVIVPSAVVIGSASYSAFHPPTRRQKRLELLAKRRRRRR